jgi:hypothetical protein
MDKNQISQGVRSGILSTINKHLFKARFCLLALLIALSLTSLQQTASAQSCAQQCQESYAVCLRAGLGLFCDDMYDACLESCT